MKRQRWARSSTWAAVGMLVGLHASAWSMCSEDLGSLTNGRSARPAARPTVTLDAPASDPVQQLSPTEQLASLVKEAVLRSNQIGAARLIADASLDDVVEARGAELPRLTVGGTVGQQMQAINGGNRDATLNASGGFSLGGVLWDAGRTAALTAYRKELSNAARFSLQAAQEQVALETISAALERARYRQQAQVYQQFSRKMACLVDALTQIVAEDRGRASELVQARKSQLQAELSRDAAMAQGRQAEIRLRKLVGDQVALGEGYPVSLVQTPNPDEVRLLMRRAGDVMQIQAQADAGERFAKAAEAATRPQLSWVANSSLSKVGDVKAVSVTAGVSISHTLFDGRAAESAAAAAAKRAMATRQQYEETIKLRQARITEIHDVAETSMDRARRYVEVLKDSERVRTATFQQWSQLGKRSLFDVMSSESDHFGLRVAYVNALFDGYQANAQLRSLAGGLTAWLGVGAVQAN